MKNIIKLLLVAVFAITCFVSCSDDNLDVANPNEIDAANFFNNVSDLELALTGVYSAMKPHDLFGADLYPKVHFGLPKTADQDWLGTDGWNQLFRNEVTSDNGLVSTFWRAFYRGVARSNDFLANANRFLEEKEVTPAQQERIAQMIGEASYLRAFYYYHIIRLWGEDIPARNAGAMGVPLILQIASTRDEMFVERNTVGEVFSQIIIDLEEAERRLPDDWNGSNIARADAFAAKAMLGKVYMAYEDYTQASEYFVDIINNSGLSLVPFEDYMGLFNGGNEFSDESIFEINFAVDMQENTWQGGLGSNIALQISPKGTGWSNVYPHDVNIQRFGNDPRLRINALEPGVDSVVFGDGTSRVLEPMVGDANALAWSFRKWVPTDFSVYSTNRTFGANLILDRLADIYLLYAEAQNALGNDAVAAEYMNKVRRRAYSLDPDTPAPGVDYTSLTGVQLRDSIREERFRELFAEGHRWYDIVRWDIVEEELVKYPSVRSGPVIYNPIDTYLPVPLREIESNPNMSPSTGYE
jgi:hypothetical protein